MNEEIDDQMYRYMLGERVLGCVMDMTDEGRKEFLAKILLDEPQMVARKLDDWEPGWRNRYT